MKMFFLTSFLILNLSDRFFGSVLSVDSEKPSQVAGLLSNIISDFIANDSGTNDVVIFRFNYFIKNERKVDDMFSKVVRKVAEVSSIMTPPIGQCVTSNEARKPAFVVIITDLYVTVSKNILKLRHHSHHHFHQQQILLDTFLLTIKHCDTSSNFIFIAVNFPTNILKYVASVFYFVRALNTILVQETTRGRLIVYSFNPYELELRKRVYEIQADRSTFDVFFPDKFRDLKGYKYQIFFHVKSGRIWKTSNGTFGIDLKVMNNIAQHQNASCQFHTIERDEKGKKFYIDALNNPNFDLTIDTSVEISSNHHQKINTFETDGYCALVPLPSRNSFVKFLIKPFDSWTWLSILLLITFCAFAWIFINKMFQTNSVSTGYFIFSCIAQFIGQSIPFRNHHAIHKMILQLTFIMTFVLGNAYQSLLISFMFNARFGEKISTVDEMINQNFSYLVDPFFKLMFETSNDYPEIRTRIVETLDDATFLNYSKLSSENVAIIMSCFDSNMLMNDMKAELMNEQKMMNFYYELPTKLYTFYLNYVMTHSSPFGNRIQELVQIIFDSGIKQKWNSRIPYENTKALKEREYYENENYFLNLEDLSNVFYILFICWIVSTVVLILEILFYHYLRCLWWNVKVKFMNRIRQYQRRSKVIQVQPI